MRIIEITGEPILHGGQEKFISNVLENMDMDGLQIDVFTPYECDNAAFQGLVRAKGGDVYALGLDFQPGKSRRALLGVIGDFLKKNQYDAAHIHSGSISVLAYGALAARKAQIGKIIVHSHCTGVASIKHEIIKNVFGPMLQNNATDYLACSYEAGAWKFPKSIVEEKLVVLNNGIPIDLYKRNDTIRKTMRTRYHIDDSCYVVGHVGRFSQQKNHQFLIDVFADLHQQIPDSRLLLVGDGELIEEIKEKVKSLDLTDAVIFTGNVDNVQDYYQMMDCFTQPSLFEGFSIVTLEAEAAGLPCVISAAIPKDVVIGGNIRQIDLSDRQAWVEQLILNKGAGPVDNEEAIRAAGYDIKDTAAAVRSLYLG